jgi:hypothetical protein
VDAGAGSSEAGAGTTTGAGAGAGAGATASFEATEAAAALDWGCEDFPAFFFLFSASCAHRLILGP